MASEEECENEMFVTIRWERGGFAAPLSQLKTISDTLAETQQAMENCHYWCRWVNMGHQIFESAYAQDVIQESGVQEVEVGY